MQHGARTADDKVAPALLGTHSNWHGLESRSGQGECNYDLHGYCGLLSDDYPSDGIREMRLACQKSTDFAAAIGLGEAGSKAPRSAPMMPSRRLQDGLSAP